MKTTGYLTIVGSAAVLLMANAVFADTDMLKGKDSVQEVTVGGYNPHGTGSQTRVREFDGRTFPGFGVEFFNAYGYNKGVQYRVNASDLAVGGDESVDFLVSSDSVIWRGSTSALTHRLVSTPAIDPWVAAQLSALTPAVPAMGIGTSWDTFKDFSPGTNYELDRRVSDMSLYVNPDSARRVGLVTGWWQEKEDGQRQLLFRARQAKAGVINNSQRGGIAQPIDRETNEATLGTDVAVGASSVVNVRLSNMTYTDNASNPSGSSPYNFLPLNSETHIGSETHTQVIKARSNITDKLQFTGVQTNRQRVNDANGIPAGYTGSGNPYSKRINSDATNVSLVYRATDSLSLTGRWRHYGVDNEVPVIYATGSTDPANPQQSSDTQSSEIEGVYTGISKAYLRFGYERRNVTQTDNPLDPDAGNPSLPFSSEKQDWNIERAALRYHPIMPLNISANYENWTTDVSQFVGTPNNRQRTNANATYMVRDNMAIYGDYSRWAENNSQVRVADPSALPTPSTDATTSEERNDAAGQGANTDFQTANIGTWYSVNSKLTLNADYGSVINNSSNWWIIGTESAYVPHLAPQVTQFKSNDTQWSTSANYVVNRRMRLRGGFYHANSNGASYVDSTKFAGLGPEWTPFKVSQNRWSVGCSYGMSSKDSLNFDYSFGKWTDNVDSANTGAFQLYRVAWARML